MEQFKLQKKINHIAFIMDGNGRWAKRRLMPRTYGHKVACKRIIEIVRFLRTLNVKVVSLYAVEKGYLSLIKVDEIKKVEKGLHRHFINKHPDLLKTLKETGDIDEALDEKIASAIKEYIDEYQLLNGDN